jgi:hypothetical protein
MQIARSNGLLMTYAGKGLVLRCGTFGNIIKDGSVVCLTAGGLVCYGIVGGEMEEGLFITLY